jgi:ABC-type sulfate/molybdate transport systems ATPase subunit
MGSNFNVIPDPERACSFLFVRTDNSSKFEMQQEQLSGGQAIRLALALLLACQQLILPDIGLLVLDEPSSHIDSEGVEQMRDLFISLRSVLQNTHMQLIIVDHNEKLTTSFETTIVL